MSQLTYCQNNFGIGIGWASLVKNCQFRTELKDLRMSSIVPIETSDDNCSSSVVMQRYLTYGKFNIITTPTLRLYFRAPMIDSISHLMQRHFKNHDVFVPQCKTNTWVRSFISRIGLHRCVWINNFPERFVDLAFIC